MMKYLRRTTSGAAGNGLLASIKYLHSTTSAAAGNGLGTTIKCLRGAAGIDLGATICRSSTCDAQRGNGLDTTAKYLRRTRSGAAGNGLSRYRGFLMCPSTTSALFAPCSVLTSFANKENVTAEVLFL